MLNSARTVAHLVESKIRVAAEHAFAREGLGLLRIFYAIAALHLYLTNYTSRHVLWGPDGYFPADVYRRLAIGPLTKAFWFAESHIWFELVFHLAIVVAALMLVGVGGRLTVAGHAFLHISLYMRNPLIMDGGDNLAHIVLLLLFLTDCTSRFRWAPAHTPRLSLRGPIAPSLGNILRPVGVLVHNAAVAAIGFQVFVVYWASAMFKIQGQMWQDGVALYYVLRVPEFTWPGVSELVYENRWIVFAITWFTVWFQLAFPPLVLSRRFRLPVLAVAVSFHLGIALLMNLWTFSLYMLATESIFVPDGTLARVRARVASWRTWATTNRNEPGGSNAAVSVHQVPRDDRPSTVVPASGQDGPERLHGNHPGIGPAVDSLA